MRALYYAYKLSVRIRLPSSPFSQEFERRQHFESCKLYVYKNLSHFNEKLSLNQCKNLHSLKDRSVETVFLFLLFFFCR